MGPRISSRPVSKAEWRPSWRESLLSRAWSWETPLTRLSTMGATGLLSYGDQGLARAQKYTPAEYSPCRSADVGVVMSPSGCATTECLADRQGFQGWGGPRGCAQRSCKREL